MKETTVNGSINIETNLGTFVFDLTDFDSFEFDKDDFIFELKKVTSDKRRIGGGVYKMFITINSLTKSFVLDREQTRSALLQIEDTYKPFFIYD